jgi:hypothetical protein
MPAGVRSGSFMVSSFKVSRLSLRWQDWERGCGSKRARSRIRGPWNLSGVFGESFQLRANGSELRTDLSVLSKFCGQATKGAWWMPWQKQAKKDVASCDKPRGAASRL